MSYSIEKGAEIYGEVSKGFGTLLNEAKADKFKTSIKDAFVACGEFGSVGNPGYIEALLSQFMSGLEDALKTYKKDPLQGTNQLLEMANQAVVRVIGPYAQMIPNVKVPDKERTQINLERVIRQFHGE